ncbi:MAG: zinc ribbon domain-containing protein [Planctomycetota bacterium]|jgi:hypothetical protein|nr:zinc ribbon domain-containing protein [Planctomycetota bacterium]
MPTSCPACGSGNDRLRRHCGQCGARLGCGACGFVNEADVKYCGGCGLRLGPAPVASDEQLAPQPNTLLGYDLAELQRAVAYERGDTGGESGARPVHMSQGDVDKLFEDD